MANRKISDLTALTAPATGDLLPIVDISEAAAADKNKKITYGELLASAPAGSAAAPSFSFDSDPNTGIYSPGADQVAISTNGVARLTSSTTALTSALAVDVPLGAAATPSLTFTGDLNTGIYSPGADQLAVATNGTGRLFIGATGNVGVGTAPSVNFHVNGAKAIISDGTQTETGLSIGTSSSSTGTNYGAIDLNGLVYAGIHLRTNNVIRSSLFQTAISTSLETNTAIPLIFTTNNTEAMRITAAGLVGIGTSSPSKKLEIANGDVRLADGYTISWGDDTYRIFRNGSQLRFDTNGSQALTIDSSGRLLVGASSDSGGALLQVNGDRIRVGTAKTPASAADTGTAGEICWDADYIYVCTATNTWKRTAISTW